MRPAKRSAAWCSARAAPRAVSGLPALVPVSRVQASYRRDYVTLFDHAAEVVPFNTSAHNRVGMALMRQGKPLDALARFQRAPAPAGYSPQAAEAPNNLGMALTALGRLDEAADCFRRGLAINSGLPARRDARKRSRGGRGPGTRFPRGKPPRAQAASAIAFCGRKE